MKTSVIAAAAIAGVATATKGGSGSSGHYGSYPPSSQNCPFIPSSDQFILFADNIQTVSQLNPNQAFLRSQDLYVETPHDLGTASSFTVPDFALGANCSLNLAVPSIDQIYGDLSLATFSPPNVLNLNFSRLLTNLPSGGLTFNTLGTIQNNGVSKVIPGQLLTLASFPCQPGGTQLPGIIQSVDAVLVQRDVYGPCPLGLFLLIDGVGNPPVSPPPPAPPASASGYHTSSGWGTASATTYATYTADAPYSSAWDA